MAEPSWFSASRAVVTDDLDDQGHVNNVRWVQWIQDIAVLHSVAVGLDPDAYRARGLLWVVREHHVTYHALGLANDALTVATAIVDAGAATLTPATRVTRGETLLVEGRTLWCMLDARRQRPTRVPADIRDAYLRPT